MWEDGLLKFATIKPPLQTLRELIQAQIDKELAERLKNNPVPTEAELLIGAFKEELEPPVRDAVFTLYRKGYASESSGFGGENGEYQQIDGFFQIDEATRQKIKELGAEVLAGEDIGFNHEGYNAIRFRPAAPDLDKIKEQWGKIAAILPELKGSGTISTSGASEAFRRQYAPDRLDLEKLMVEDLLAHGRYDPETAKQMEAWLKETEQAD